MLGAGEPLDSPPRQAKWRPRTELGMRSPIQSTQYEVVALALTAARMKHPTYTQGATRVDTPMSPAPSSLAGIAAVRVDPRCEVCRIEAEEVIYDRSAKLITAFGPATLTGSEFEVSGTGLEVDLGAEATSEAYR